MELPLARNYPPCVLEWRANRKRVHMALPVSLPDEETVMAAADSWTTCEELAGHVVREKGYYLFFIVYYLFIKIPQARGEGGSYHLPHRGILTVTGKKTKGIEC